MSKARKMRRLTGGHQIGKTIKVSLDKTKEMNWKEFLDGLKAAEKPELPKVYHFDDYGDLTTEGRRQVDEVLARLMEPQDD